MNNLFSQKKSQIRDAYSMKRYIFWIRYIYYGFCYVVIFCSMTIEARMMAIYGNFFFPLVECGENSGTARRIDVNLWVLTRNSLPLPCKVHRQKNKLSVLLAARLHGFNFHHLLPSCLHAFHFCCTFFTNSVASFFYICKCCWLWKGSMFTLNPWPSQGLL